MNRRSFFSRLFGGAAAAVVPVAAAEPKPKKETFTLETIEMKVEVIKCYTKTTDGGWIASTILTPAEPCPHGAT